MQTHIRSQWISAPGQENCRTGVSLHSHTLHSRENFEFIRRAGLRTPVIAGLILHVEARYYKRHGKRLSLDEVWWTPPLSPREVWTQERAQLQQLGYEPLVAITDHDDMQAPLGLRMSSECREVPVAPVPLALEWTVPFGPTFFHLGIYNLPGNRALELFRAMQEYRTNPDLRRLPEILAAVTESPSTLVVFNHPLWDEAEIGETKHEEAVRIFLQMYEPHIHAIELNGLRPPEENTRARSLAITVNKPAISGGDRHGGEPNAVINLTNAVTFSEFVEEIRSGCSRILFLNAYRKPYRWRMLRATLDMFRNYDHHPNGWRVWTDRGFHRGDDGHSRSWTQVLNSMTMWGRLQTCGRLLIGLTSQLAPERGGLR
jgi:hypothetical protein